MSPQTLQAQLQATPFRSFDIELADGKTIAVTHPDFVWFPPNAPVGEIVIYGAEGGYHIVHLGLATTLKVHPKAKTKAKAA